MVLAQGTPRSQPAGEASNVAQAQASFESAKAALVNLKPIVAVTQPSPNHEQTGDLQQAGSAYAQVEQQTGQALDLTA